MASVRGDGTHCLAAVAEPLLKTTTVNIGFRNHPPPSEGSRFLNPARPLKQGSGYRNQVVAKSRVWV